MFRRGFDTAAISAMLEVKESAIERVLHVALDSDRMAGSLLLKQRWKDKKGKRRCKKKKTKTKMKAMAVLRRTLRVRAQAILDLVRDPAVEAGKLKALLDMKSDQKMEAA